MWSYDSQIAGLDPVSLMGREYGDFLSIKKGDLTNVEQNFRAMDLNGNGTWSFEEFQVSVAQDGFAS